ncbi:MAG: thioesterase family protein [Clostridia bacterium]
MELKVGMSGIFRVTVEENMLAIAMKSGANPVFATPWMIAIMEAAAQDCVAEALEEGNSTVGTKVDIAHIASTPLGAQVRAEAELLEIDRRRLVFKVRAYDEFELIGEGTHERFIVDSEKFVLKCNSKKL